MRVADQRVEVAARNRVPVIGHIFAAGRRHFMERLAPIQVRLKHKYSIYLFISIKVSGMGYVLLVESNLTDCPLRRRLSRFRHARSWP
jgi:hypothetical protein